MQGYHFSHFFVSLFEDVGRVGAYYFSVWNAERITEIYLKFSSYLDCVKTMEEYFS